VAIEILPEEELPAVTRLKEFTAVVSAVISEGEEGGGSSSIVSVSASIVGSPDPGLRITPGETSVTISGKHITGFEDILTYVDKGQSDLTQTPKKAVGIQNMPNGQTLFDLKQDGKQQLERQFAITVTLSDNSVQTFTLKQIVQNDLESIRSFMGSYFK